MVVAMAAKDPIIRVYSGTTISWPSHTVRLLGMRYWMPHTVMIATSPQADENATKFPLLPAGSGALCPLSFLPYSHSQRKTYSDVCSSMEGSLSLSCRLLRRIHPVLTRMRSFESARCILMSFDSRKARRTYPNSAHDSSHRMAVRIPIAACSRYRWRLGDVAPSKYLIVFSGVVPSRYSMYRTSTATSRSREITSNMGTLIAPTNTGSAASTLTSTR
mmetsp:Transcript_28729/g.67214  ORF Transcript_28729/g.67214 Transcript_28729/m.67214 type:complete len:218 (-) Transcript_28729:640-1293(-)